MPTRPRPKLDLHVLMLALAACAALTTLVNTFWVMYSTQKQEMIDNALAVNKAYATRIATSVEGVLDSDLDRLRYGAASIGAAFTDSARLASEAKRLQEQDNSFNSVLIANADGTIVAAAPATLQLTGKRLHEREPLQQHQPMISSAFKSIAGHLVVFVSHPVFGPNGNYLGLVGGTLRLEQANTLSALMDLNVRQGGAHAYLVDDQRRVLYHPDPALVGTTLPAAPIIDAALRTGTGTLRARDAAGEEMLAGYAHIPSSHWGVVSQQPMAYIQATLEASTVKVAKGIIPLGLIGSLLIWWLGTRISRPLSRLAESAKRLDNADAQARIRAIPADYAESWQIRRGLLLGATLLAEKIGRLNQEALSDALTGLANRRAMEDKLELWEQSQTPLAVVSIDIDHFKRVNDTYGHGAGDDTLRAVASLMRQHCRSSDLLCRTGGEEFALLLPGVTLEAAVRLAEKLRVAVADMSLETVGHITVSLGVAVWGGQTPLADTLEQADRLLYQAKQQGRNRVAAQVLAAARLQG